MIIRWWIMNNLPFSRRPHSVAWQETVFYPKYPSILNFVTQDDYWTTKVQLWCWTISGLNSWSRVCLMPSWLLLSFCPFNRSSWLTHCTVNVSVEVFHHTKSHLFVKRTSYNLKSRKTSGKNRAVLSAIWLYWISFCGRRFPTFWVRRSWNVRRKRLHDAATGECSCDLVDALTVCNSVLWWWRIYLSVCSPTQTHTRANRLSSRVVFLCFPDYCDTSVWLME